REDYASFLKLVFRLSNVCGALITMPHKVVTLDLVDEASVSAKIAGACNAVKMDENGRLIGDMFDGEGFVRGVQRKGRRVDGASLFIAGCSGGGAGGGSLFIAGCGGVGSAIAASMAKAGIARLGLHDVSEHAMAALVKRLQ